MEGVDLFFTIAYDIMIGTSRMGQIKLNNEAVVKFGLLHDCQYLNDKHWQRRTWHLTPTHTHTHQKTVQKSFYKITKT